VSQDSQNYTIYRSGHECESGRVTRLRIPTQNFRGNEEKIDSAKCDYSNVKRCAEASVWSADANILRYK
jgi:hypothetical protein